MCVLVFHQMKKRLEITRTNLEQAECRLQEKKAELNETTKKLNTSKEELFTLQTDVRKWRYIAESQSSATTADQQTMEKKLAAVHKQVTYMYMYIECLP